MCWIRCYNNSTNPKQRCYTVYNKQMPRHTKNLKYKILKLNTMLSKSGIQSRKLLRHQAKFPLDSRLVDSSCYKHRPIFKNVASSVLLCYFSYISDGYNSGYLKKLKGLSIYLFLCNSGLRLLVTALRLGDNCKI